MKYNTKVKITDFDVNWKKIKRFEKRAGIHTD